MTAADIAMMTRELAPIIKRYVEQVTGPLVTRNKELELRVLELETRPTPMVPERGEPGQKGDTGISVASVCVNADHRLIVHYTDGRVQDVGPVPSGPPGERGAKGDEGRPGADAPPVDADAIVSAVLARLPAPEKGDRGEMGPQGLAGNDGAPGADGAPGRDGLNGKDGVPGVDGAPGRDGLNGKDGIGVMDAVLERTGHLILTLSDGRTKDVGLVTGRDGVDGLKGADGAAGLAGRDGRDVDMETVKALVLSELSTWARPKDGRDGLDGKDGLGFDDFDLTFDPARGVVLQLRQGERTKDFVCPQPFFVADWSPGVLIPKGGCVQWDGGWWTALQPTSEAPSEKHQDWRLLVRRGKQGKEGKPGKDAPIPRTTNTPPLYGQY